MTIARVTGRFTVQAGEVTVPAEDPSDATVTATVPVRTVSSGHPARDERIRSADFLDAERYPVMEFVSHPAGAGWDDRWSLPGDLTIKGTTRPVVFDTEFGGIVTHRGAVRELEVELIRTESP
jgi:polyisoprenoid-binding protein YceI